MEYGHIDALSSKGMQERKVYALLHKALDAANTLDRCVNVYGVVHADRHSFRSPEKDPMEC